MRSLFQGLGNVISRYWPAFLVIWAAVLATAFWTAPSWEDVVVDREFAFLPEDMPSQKAQEDFKKAFPEQFNPSSLVLVLYRRDREISPEDKDFVAQELHPGLKQIKKAEGGAAHDNPETDHPSGSKLAEQRRPIIAAIHTPQEPGTGGLLLSQDGKAMLVIVEFASELLEKRNWATLARVDGLLGRLEREHKIPAGLEIRKAGSAVVGADVTERQRQSSNAIGRMTITVVIVLLLLIYRAPLLTLVPLITVFVAVELALRFLSLLADANLITLFEGVQIFITVLMYGTGVDYCVFLMSRYQEELDHGTAPKPATANALGKVGAAVAASSLTVTLGIGMMTFARFGQFHDAGIDIACSLFLGLFAVLTLTPALLRLAGRWAFWPRSLKHMQHPASAVSLDGHDHSARPQRRFLQRLRKIVTLGLSWDKLAAAIEHRPGTIWLGTVALMLPFAVVAVLNANNLEFDLVKRLPADASSLVGEKTLREHFPAGITGPVIVLIRKSNIDFESDAGLGLISTLTDRLQMEKKDLGLADIRSVTRPLGSTQAAQDALDEIAVEQQSQGKKSQGKKRAVGGYDKAIDFYVSHVHTTQLQLVLNDDPLSRGSLSQFEYLKSAVRSSLPEELHGAEIGFLGLTASIYDLRVVTDADQWRIEGLVVAAVLIILILLLRRPVVCVYLIVSVLLCFLTALGATFAFFWLQDPRGFSGLDWKVPIFLFTILVAIGEDYNIFLMTRIHEEQEHHGPVPGVGVGLTKTGRIITTCGIIMAGTFSALLPATLVDLKQLGFALVFGVLLDTFVVRPVLVPAFLVMLDGGRFRCWRKRSEPGSKEHEGEAAEPAQAFAGQRRSA